MPISPNMAVPPPAPRRRVNVTAVLLEDFAELILNNDVFARYLDITLAVKIANRPRDRLSSRTDHVRDLLVRRPAKPNPSVLEPNTVLTGHFQKDARNAAVYV